MSCPHFNWGVEGATASDQGCSQVVLTGLTRFFFWFQRFFDDMQIVKKSPLFRSHIPSTVQLPKLVASTWGNALYSLFLWLGIQPPQGHAFLLWFIKVLRVF